MNTFFNILLNKHLIRPATEFVDKMIDNIKADILAEVQFIIDGIDGIDGVFTRVEDFLAAVAEHFPGIPMIDIPFSIDASGALKKLQKLLDALNLDIPVAEVSGAIEDKIAEVISSVAGALNPGILDDLVGVISDTVNDLVNEVSTAAMNMVKVAELAFEGAINAVLSGVELVVDGVEGVITGVEAIGAFLANTADDALAAILDAMTINIPDLSDIFDGLFDFLPDFGFLDHIGDFANAILEAILSFDFTAGLDFVEHITDAVSHVIKSIADVASLDGIR